MADFNYRYSVDGDTAANAVNTTALKNEIAASLLITVAINRIDTSGDTLDIIFKAELSEDEHRALDEIVGAHTAPPTLNPTLESGVPIVHIDTPVEPDGKTIMVISPATEGTMTWFTSRGDDMVPTPPATGRGEGQAMSLSFDGPGSKSVEFQFSGATEIHDGRVWYTPVDNWTNADQFSFSVRIPANTPVPNMDGTGNCNLVVVGPGMHAIVPASGDGTHDVDLATASPCYPPRGVPAYYTFGVYDDLRVSTNTEKDELFTLFDFEVNSYFIKNVAMGDPLGIFDIDVYKVELCHMSWLFKLECEKVSEGVGDVGGWLMLFRKDST